jgi:histone acetyltransferase (RNA polymerase elongator complex component)
MGSHANISFFVQHLGCTHRCTFCDQRAITGQNKLPNASDIKQGVETAVKSPFYTPHNTEIAFFGGSFTAIEKEYMISLLDSAYVYVKNGAVSGIRVSTRPDAIDRERLEILKKYGVSAIELGAQSMDDLVLSANKRGHTCDDVKNACALIKEYGFSLGLQMMSGLYKSTFDTDRKTVEEFIKLSPDTVRIYPTVVLKHTALAKLVKSGEYLPLSLVDAVEQCCQHYIDFSKQGIKVIRMGLHSINEEDYVVGPWHPAFSQMCMSRIYLSKIKNEIDVFPKGKVVIKVNSSEISTFVGQKKSNIKELEKIGYVCSIKGEANIPIGDFKIEGDVK